VQVWQAILTKKVDLESRKIRNAMSDGARDLLKASFTVWTERQETMCCLLRQ
jgi:hypothetical protein